MCSLDPLDSPPYGTSQGLGTNNKVNIFSRVKGSLHFISFLLWGSLFMWFNTYQIKVIMGVPMMLYKEPNYSCLIPLLIQLVVSLSQANFPETLISWKMKIYFCMGTTLDWTSNSTQKVVWIHYFSSLLRKIWLISSRKPVSRQRGSSDGLVAIKLTEELWCRFVMMTSS